MIRKKWWIIGAATAGVVLTGAITIIVLAVQAPEETFGASGTVTVSQVDDKTCTGTYDGLRSGAQVTVTDRTGVVLAVGQLGTARASADPAKTSFGGQRVLIGATICEFPWTVPRVPTGDLSYGVTIASRPTFQATEAELRAGLRLQ